MGETSTRGYTREGSRICGWVGDPRRGNDDDQEDKAYVRELDTFRSGREFRTEVGMHEKFRRGGRK